MTPDARTQRNPDPAYLAGLLARIDRPKTQVAARLGITPRSIELYLSGKVTCPYCVQYALEVMAHHSL